MSRAPKNALRLWDGKITASEKVYLHGARKRRRLDDGLSHKRMLTTLAKPRLEVHRFSFSQRQNGTTSPSKTNSPPRGPAVRAIAQKNACARKAYSTTSNTAAASSHLDSIQQHSHFSALASSWWDPHGPSRLLHLMNPMRHQFINLCLESPFQPTGSASPEQNRHYLDIGCGGGIFAESAARLPGTASVTGIDPNPEVLRVARDHARRDPFLEVQTSKDESAMASERQQRPRLEYLNTTLENLPLPDSVLSTGFNVVTLFEVIEHLPHPAQTIDTISQHLKPGGWMILSTIARTWTSWATTKVMAEDLLGMVPRGTHDWEKYLNWKEIEGWLSDSGKWDTRSLRVMGVVYVPGLGWKEVPGSEDYGNYFLGVRKMPSN